ncbi:MAG: hypothetical protein ABF636_12495 [Acetobacter sp.]
MLAITFNAHVTRHGPCPKAFFAHVRAPIPPRPQALTSPTMPKIMQNHDITLARHGGLGKNPRTTKPVPYFGQTWYGRIKPT